MCAALALLLSLSGCGSKTIDGESIRAHYEKLEGFTAQIKILSDLDNSVLEYVMEYVYNKDGNDTFTVSAPESLNGISGSIAGDGSEGFSLQYDGMALDDAMPQRTGLSPADGFFALLCDLKNEEPAQIWTENVSVDTLTALRYEYDRNGVKTEKQVWLSKDLQPVCAELFADGDRVITIQVTDIKNNN